MFGSAVTSNFDAAKNDVDFLVDFASETPDPFDAYFGLKEDLEHLFERKVDLVMTTAIRNPYFKASALANAEELYAA